MTAFNFIEALHFASSPNGAGVLFLVFAAPCAWLGWRVSRSGLKIAPDGIRVRGPLRDWQVEPSEAVQFTPGVQGGAGNGTPCPILERVNGKSVGVWALGKEGLVWNYDDYLEELKPLCERLNGLLEQQHPKHPLPVFHKPMVE